LVKKRVNGCERTLGFDKSNPTKCRKPNKAEPVMVSTKLTENWMVSLLSLPNISIDIRDDKTNIQANEQMNIVKSAFEFINKANAGIVPPKEKVTVVRAV
jgi:hypothetical protein